MSSQYGISPEFMTIQSLIDCPEVYLDYTIRHLTECDHGTIWNSALVQRSQWAEDGARGASASFSLPVERAEFGVDLFGNVSKALSCPPKDCPSATEMKARKLSFVKCWGQDECINFFRRCTDEDALTAFYGTLSVPYWRQYYSAAALLQLVAAYKALSVLAPYNTQAVFDVVTPAGANNNGYTELNNITINNSMNISACNDLDGIIVHREVFTHMRNQSLIQCSCAEDGVSQLYFFEGKRVTVADSLLGRLLKAGDSATIPAPNSQLANLGFAGPAGSYLSICYRTGAIHYGEGCHRRPIVVENDECANGGNGATSIIERRILTMHLEGMNFNWEPALSSDPASVSPPLPDFGNPAFFTPAFSADRLPFKFIITDLA